jgi:hypothetical protein
MSDSENTRDILEKILAGDRELYSAIAVATLRSGVEQYYVSLLLRYLDEEGLAVTRKSALATLARVYPGPMSMSSPELMVKAYTLDVVKKALMGNGIFDSGTADEAISRMQNAGIFFLQRRDES